MPNYLGAQYHNLLNWFSQTWLPGGPPVCYLTGFSGTGKTTLARNLIQQTERPAVLVELSENSADRFDNLLLELAMDLSTQSIPDMANAVDRGMPLQNALTGVLTRPVLIVIDEFQRALDDAGQLSGPLVGLLDRLSRLPRAAGRLLVISNREFRPERWCEAAQRRQLRNLPLDEGEQLLDQLLRERDRADEVPPERRRDVVSWLAGNPRALGVLVGALEYDSLDALIGLDPDLWELRDREVAPELLERLERALLERNLQHLDPPSERVLRFLAVHRTAVERPAFDQLLSGGIAFETVRDQLISRFLMEHHRGWFSLNPIMREVARQRLRERPAELRQAHSCAADYYTRHFKAQNLTSGQLGGHFVEARYHLVQAGREDDLETISRRFTQHLQALYGTTSPVPQAPDELNERIATLAALLTALARRGLSTTSPVSTKHADKPAIRSGQSYMPNEPSAPTHRQTPGSCWPNSWPRPAAPTRPSPSSARASPPLLPTKTSSPST